MSKFLTSRMKSLREASIAPLMPFLMLCALLMGGMSARAATLTVTSLADSGAGSLRAQVAAAAAGDTINFSVTGTIDTLTPGIAINKNLLITGPGAGLLTLSGVANDANSGSISSDSGIFKISGGVVGISGLTLRDGLGTNDYGGAILVDGGTVTLSNLLLTNNFGTNGGGIAQRGGTLSVVGCTVSNSQSAGNGGGIYVDGGNFTMTDSTVSGNTSQLGGGLYFVPPSGNITAQISNSTISGNFAMAVQVAADVNQPSRSVNGWGGGLFSAQGSTVTLTNSTVSGNRSDGNQGGTAPGGGGLWNRGTMTVTSSTVTNNTSYGRGGGILNSAALNLSNSIVAGNFSNYPETNDLVGGTSTASFDLIGGSPILGPLANNGGPTLTHRLLAGSPAADTGDPNFNTASLPFDQRGAGFPRVKNGRLDIGAYESNVNDSEPRQSGSNLVVNSLADTDDGICGLGDCTLREAVSAVPAGGTITFSVAGTITLTQGEILIDKNLSISGPTNPQGTTPGITVSGGGASRIFNVSDGASASSPRTVSFSELTLSNGNGVGSVSTSNGFGGALLMNPGTTGSIVVSVSNCTFSGNSAPGNSNTSGTGFGAGPGNGGAIRAGTSKLTVTGSTFSGNSATGSGGAIQSGGTVNISNSTFSGNRATGTGSTTGLGGALRNNGGALAVTNSTFSGNSAFTSGGGIATGTGTSTLSLSNTLVAGNSAPVGPDVSGVVASGDYNLVQNASGATLSGTHNITGQSPLLGALLNNGGPTQTFALLTGSPAINAGDPTLNGSGQFDQRGAGFPRVQNGRLDIGAFEQTILSISAASVAEGNTGTGTPESGTNFLLLPLTLSSASPADVTVSYRTSNGTATAGSDYLGTTNSSVTIPAGQTSGNIVISILGDRRFESNETFTVTLTSASGVALGTATATGTIINDDQKPTVSINSLSQKEGNSGTSALSFTVSLSVPSDTDTVIPFSTSDGTATAGSDYLAVTNGSVTIPAGQTSIPLSITINGDTTVESDESFNVLLATPVGDATLSPQSTGVGTLENDDGTPTSAATVAAGVTVLKSGFTRNRSTNRLIQTVVVQNNSGAAIAGPVYLALDNLSGGRLYGAAGTTFFTSPIDSPYRIVVSQGSVLPTGPTLVYLEFVTQNSSVSFTPRVLVGPGSP